MREGEARRASGWVAVGIRRAARGWDRRGEAHREELGRREGLGPREGEVYHEGLGRREGLGPREGEVRREVCAAVRVRRTARVWAIRPLSLAARAQVSREYDSTFGQPRNPRLME